VSGWASVNEATEGPPVYDVVAKYIERVRTVRLQPHRHVTVVAADPAGMTAEGR
jgi:sulfur-oxidizing protein SoxB